MKVLDAQAFVISALIQQQRENASVIDAGARVASGLSSRSPLQESQIITEHPVGQLCRWATFEYVEQAIVKHR